MSAKVKGRVAARGWVTRASQAIDELLRAKPLDIQALQYSVDEFDKRLEKLDDIQSEVELELEDEDIESDIDAANAFRTKACVTRVAALKKLSVGIEPEPSSYTSQAKLPKLQLPDFDGDVLKWGPFWEQFVAVVDSGDMSEVTKFTYLRSLLQGEAKATIQGLSLSGQHYKAACELLQRRYGRPDKIIFAHVQQLLHVNIPKNVKVSELWSVYNELVSSVRSLEGLGVSGEQYGVILTPLILSRLPADIRLEWARGGEEHVSDLEWLLKFLYSEIERRERSHTFSNSNSGQVSSTPSATAKPTVAALHSATQCPVCSKTGHPLEKCFMLLKMSVTDRRQVLQKAKTCYKCLSTETRHRFKTCRSRCSKCNGWHHVVLCEKATASNGTNNANADNTANDNSGHANSSTDQSIEQSTSNVSAVSCTSTSKATIMLQTLKVKVKGTNGDVDAVVLFDTGSDKTYVSKRITDMVNPEWVTSESVAYSTFGNRSSSKPETRNVYNVQLQGVKGGTSNVVATEIDVICSPLFCPTLPQGVLDSFVEVIDVCAGQDVVVDFLIGLDNYWRIVCADMVSLSEGLVAQKTCLGWFVSGILPSTSGID